MEYARLGSAGVKVSRICVGTARFGVAPSERDADRVVHAALDLGINFVDTADVYGILSTFDRPGAPPPPNASRPSGSSAAARRPAGRRGDRHQVMRGGWSRRE
jgi:1-deoxyxylulose-5-phosphate synthase